MLTRGGLGTIYNNCENFKEGDDLKTQIGMDSDSVQSGSVYAKLRLRIFSQKFLNFKQFVKPEKAMNQFDSYLSQPDGHQLPQFGLLSSPIIRDKIIKKVSSHLLPDIFVKDPT